MPKKTTAKQQKTFISYVIDESGSMAPLVTDVVDGFNRYVADLRKQPATFLTLEKFDHEFVTVYTAKPISDVEDLAPETYRPRGSTALLDAIGRAVRTLENQVTKDDRALVVIMTDGYENASREFTRESVKQLISEHEARGNWTFVYMGANQDAFTVGTQMGFAGANTLSYAGTHQGTQNAFTRAAGATMVYASSGAKASTNFFAGDSVGDAALQPSFTPPTVDDLSSIRKDGPGKALAKKGK